MGKQKLKKRLDEIKHAKENAETVEQMKDFGLLTGEEIKGKSNYEIIEGIKKGREQADNDLSEKMREWTTNDDEKDMTVEDNSVPELELVHIGKKGRYPLDEKILAIMFMEVFQHEWRGEIIPHYSMVSNMFGYSDVVLRNWWEKKNEITQQKNTMLDKGMKYVQVKMMNELIRMSSALSHIDYTKMTEKPAQMKNFISLFNTLINKMRLMSNLSTENVAHAHKGEVAMIIPDGEEGNK